MKLIFDTRLDLAWNALGWGHCRHVGIGSDLDGGFGTEQTPHGLDTIADLQKLAGILAARGYGDDVVDAFFHGNCLRFFRQHLPTREGAGWRD